MNLTNIRPFEASKFNVRTMGFRGLCSFCGEGYDSRQRAAEFMGNSNDRRLWALCHMHGRQAKFDERQKCTASGLDRAECRLGGKCVCHHWSANT